ncbi:MAG: class I SAM-dependent methyltransferase [Betaproteobacteria bacterium]|nr:class I SAM-dependent methyltransferase [Betaproteobacteria bacterium]
MLEPLSAGMRWARKLGWERLAWSLRRLHCPVDRKALVLEVGSGGNPYPRANVLLDAHEATRERHWVPLAADRPLVLGRVESLPFRDRSFDFVIASHVLEHSADPARFLGELQRVARAGYIEVPDAFMERVNPYHDHRLEVTSREGSLVIRKKPGWRADPELVQLYEHRAKPLVAGRLIPAHPFEFHVRFYWESRIGFAVLNPEVRADWPAPHSADIGHNTPMRTGWRGKAMQVLRATMSQTRRNKSINLTQLLQCPSCGSTEISSHASSVDCGACHATYPIRHGVPAMFPVTQA